MEEGIIRADSWESSAGKDLVIVVQARMTMKKYGNMVNGESWGGRDDMRMTMKYIFYCSQEKDTFFFPFLAFS